jgi:hypothetical protein
MTYGNCRVTVLDPMGRPYVADVKEGDIWYFRLATRIPCRASGRTVAHSLSASTPATPANSTRFW